mgnify:CR=1 FL=1
MKKAYMMDITKAPGINFMQSTRPSPACIRVMNSVTYTIRRRNVLIIASLRPLLTPLRYERPEIIRLIAKAQTTMLTIP